MESIENEYLKVSADAHGAELKSVYSTRYGCEYMWQGNKNVWGGTAPVLFPFCGRLNGAKFTYQGVTYPMGNHGFARHTDFQPTVEGNKITYTLKSDEETKKIYPFDFTLKVCYQLFCSSVEVTYFVTNDGDEELIFAAGAHPGFNVPLEKGLTFEDYQLKNLKVIEKVVMSENLLGTDRLERLEYADGNLPLTHDLFVNDAIFRKNYEYGCNNVRLASPKGQRYVEVRCPQAKYTGFWSKPTEDATFVCIEPWDGLFSPDTGKDADELTEKPLMHRLRKGETYEFVYLMEFN